MATKSAHIVLETNRMAAFLKMVRGGDVSNLARIGPNVSPWGGAPALARETSRTIFKITNYDRVLKVVCGGEDNTHRLWGGATASWKHCPHHHHDDKETSCESQIFLSFL